MASDTTAGPAAPTPGKEHHMSEFDRWTAASRTTRSACGRPAFATKLCRGRGLAEQAPHRARFPAEEFAE